MAQSPLQSSCVSQESPTCCDGTWGFCSETLSMGDITGNKDVFSPERQEALWKRVDRDLRLDGENLEDVMRRAGDNIIYWQGREMTSEEKAADQAAAVDFILNGGPD